MTSARQFEELEVWKKARLVTREIYAVSSKGAFSRNFGLCDQIQRAAVSVMSNIAEGFEREGNKEFRQFLALAKGSAGEIRSQLYVALDAGFLQQSEFQQLYNSVIELSRLIAGLMRYLNASDYKGNKFKEASGPEYHTEGPDSQLERLEPRTSNFEP